MSRESLFRQWKRLPHPIRWVGVAIVGSVFIIAGIAMLVLPGPGLVFIALGVAVLATEFAWAESILRRMKQTGSAAMDRVRSVSRRRPPPAS